MTFRIKIVMPDGSCGRFMGIFSDGFAAVDSTLVNFPDAKRVSAMCLRGAQA